jgi:plasmid stabilization system protein ParE
LPRVRKTVLAENDLEEIWFYIALDNPEAADALLDKIDGRALRRSLVRRDPEGFPPMFAS